MANLSWILFSILMSNVCALKILVVFPLPSGSHGILGNGIVMHLLAAGHEVTYITPYVNREPLTNLTIVDVASNVELFNPQALDIKALMSKEIKLDEDVITEIMSNVAKGTVNHKNVQTLLRDTSQQFDVVVVEWMFNHLVASFGPLFDCPFIWASSLEPHWLITSLVDEYLHPAYNPDYKTNYLPPFSFTQRVHQLWNLMIGEYKRHFVYFKREKEIYNNDYVPIFTARGKTAPLYEDFLYNASLVLSNSHVSLGLPMRLPQNLKPIGGYHIQSEVKPLPQDLQSIIDNAKHGVIYFSMGTNLKSKDLPEDLKRNLIKMFGSLKQTVLWKFEEKIPDLPNNVHILQWAPQQSILAHPNVVLFITHGGLLSTTETIHYGVPIIGVPVFADQFSNTDRAVKNGYALKVDLTTTMTDELKEAIEEVITNKKYRSRVKELSLVYHHRPISPGAELVHWVEHVVYTRGAPHLRSSALQVPWYQKLYLDLLVLIVSLIFALTLILKRTLCQGKSCNNLDKKKK